MASRGVDIAGYRVPHWMGDLCCPIRPAVGNDAVLSHDAITGVDVDYYWDSFSSRAGHTIILYTFTPETYSGVDGDASYHVENGKYVVEVPGGGRYEHHVWDFSKDKVLIYGTEGGVWLYDVNRHKLSSTRSIVILTVARRMSKFTFLLGRSVGRLAGVEPIRRVALPKNGLVCRRIAGHAVRYEFAEIGEHSYSVTVSNAFYFSMLAMVAQKKAAKAASVIQTSSVESYNASLKEGLSAADTAFIAKFLLAPSDGWQRAITIAIPGDDTAEEQYTHVAPGLAEPACGFATTPTTESESIRVRIDDVRNTNAFTPEQIWYAEEFVGEFLRPMMPSRPLSDMEVAEAQNKPLQAARRLQATGDSVPSELTSTSTFSKKEVVMVKPGKQPKPRCINTCPTTYVEETSRYTHKMKQLMIEHHSWFACGKTPEEVTSLLSVRAKEQYHGGNGSESCEALAAADISTMDGTVSPDMHRLVVMPCVLGAFEREEALDFAALLASEVGVKTKGKKSGKRSKVTGTVTGSSITTIKNSIVCAFLIYVAARNKGLTQKEAFACIYAVQGDDSVASNKVLDHLEEAATSFGMQLKLDTSATVYRCEFLSRVHINLLEEQSCNYPVVARAAAKLCTVEASGERVRQAVDDKTKSWIMSEGNLPLLTPYAAAVRRVWGLKRLTAPPYKGDRDSALYHMTLDTGLDIPHVEELLGRVENNRGADRNALFKELHAIVQEHNLGGGKLDASWLVETNRRLN